MCASQTFSKSVRGIGSTGIILELRELYSFIKLTQRQRAFYRRQFNSRVEASIIRTHPLISLTQVMSDDRRILGDQEIFHQGRQRLISLALRPTVEGFGMRREHFNDQSWIDQSLNSANPFKYPLAADSSRVQITIRRQGWCFDRLVSAEGSAVSSYELAFQNEDSIHTDVTVLPRTPAHAEELAIPILISDLAGGLDSEVLFDRVQGVRNIFETSNHFFTDSSGHFVAGRR